MPPATPSPLCALWDSGSCLVQAAERHVGAADPVEGEGGGGELWPAVRVSRELEGQSRGWAFWAREGLESVEAGSVPVAGV